MTLAVFGVFFALAQSASAQNGTADAHELLARGAQLIPSKPAEAVKVLQNL
jgi:hypothetical protein